MKRIHVTVTALFIALVIAAFAATPSPQVKQQSTAIYHAIAAAPQEFWPSLKARINTDETISTADKDRFSRELAAAAPRINQKVEKAQRAQEEAVSEIAILVTLVNQGTWQSVGYDHATTPSLLLRQTVGKHIQDEVQSRLGGAQQ